MLFPVNIGKNSTMFIFMFISIFGVLYTRNKTYILMHLGQITYSTLFLNLYLKLLL